MGISVWEGIDAARPKPYEFHTVYPGPGLGRKYPPGSLLSHQESPEIIAKYDLVMITTIHTNVDYEMFLRNAKEIFDTKNVTKILPFKENIEVL